LQLEFREEKEFRKENIYALSFSSESQLSIFSRECRSSTNFQVLSINHSSVSCEVITLATQFSNGKILAN
jgi:hypothetical protein